jgi:NADH-quinone oxidoreductase subunit B
MSDAPTDASAPGPLSAEERDELRRHGILLTSVQELYNWGRSHSVWPLNFGLACCAIEMIAASMAKFDIARFGSEVFRPSPRQADLIIVSGTVTKKMAPHVVRLWNQMPEPKYCIAMGAWYVVASSALALGRTPTSPPMAPGCSPNRPS